MDKYIHNFICSFCFGRHLTCYSNWLTIIVFVCWMMNNLVFFRCDCSFNLFVFTHYKVKMEEEMMTLCNIMPVELAIKRELEYRNKMEVLNNRHHNDLKPLVLGQVKPHINDHVHFNILCYNTYC